MRRVAILAVLLVVTPLASCGQGDGDDNGGGHGLGPAGEAVGPDSRGLGSRDSDFPGSAYDRHVPPAPDDDAGEGPPPDGETETGGNAGAVRDPEMLVFESDGYADRTGGAISDAPI